MKSVVLLCLMVVLFAYEGSRCHPGGPINIEIEEATVSYIHSVYKECNFTSRKLVEFYLRRIERLNPHLRAVIEVNPDAIRLADAADAQRQRAGGYIGGLHGIPVLLADNIATRDELNTTAGSFALLGSKVARDAGVVGRLRKSGAIVLGKANMDEWAACRSRSAPGGWSARGGLTKNPYDGSSAGYGSDAGYSVAVSTNMATVALATENYGGILDRATHNGVVGIKPTVGLTSRSGLVVFSHHRTTVGPIGRSVSDAVFVLDEIVGYDELDHEATRFASQFIPEGGYKRFLTGKGLFGKRVGIVRDPFLDSKNIELLGFHNMVASNELASSFNNHMATLRQQGATLVDILETSTAPEDLSWKYVDSSKESLYEFKSNLHLYLSKLLESPVRTLADIIDFNNQHAMEEGMHSYLQELLQMAQNTPYNLNVETTMKALERESSLPQNGIDKLLSMYKLDALVAPIYTLSPTLLSPFPTYSFINSILSTSGYPAITVPAGYTASSPFGICFSGTKGSEPILIEIAYAFEQATQLREIPTW